MTTTPAQDGAPRTDPDPEESGQYKRLVSRLFHWLGVHLRRHTFALRVAVALGVSMALLVVASQVFFTRVITDQLVNEGARSYAAQGVAFEQAYREGDDPQDGLDDALDLVDAIRDRPDIVSAAIFNSKQREVVAPRDAGDGNLVTGRLDPHPKFDQALSEGLSYSGVETEGEEGNSHFEYVVPVRLGGEPYVLEVDQDAYGLNTQVAALRNKTVIFTSIALLLAMGLFYLIAGRALMLRHGKARKRATRDPLTDLGNHRSFQEELPRLVEIAQRRDQSMALALVDIDEFKLVNDRFGHQRGDDVLLDLALVLASGRGEDSAFRIGGDEFALLMPRTDGDTARIALERVVAAAAEESNPTSVTAGIAVITPGVEADATVLREQADAALYEGKRTGGGRVTVFDEVAEHLSVITPAKVHALRSLLDKPRLDTTFQPIWDLQEDEVLGYEALAGPWSGYGFDGPTDAFAVAEKIGRAHDLDEICRAAVLGSVDELPDGVLLFLNVHPQSLTHSTVDGDRLVRAVRAAGLAPEQVVLEITERPSAQMDRVIASATRLRELGFQLALDEVGAANSGLEMLRELPVDFVKIDPSVTASAVEDPRAQAVLFGIIAFARRAGAYVIAEGIESERILSFVRDAPEMKVINDQVIDGGQGLLLGRPDPDLTEANLHQRVRPRRPRREPATL